MSAKPVYLITGGPSSDRKQMALDFHAALAATETANPKVAYIGTASGDSRLFFAFLKKPMRNAGAKSVTLVPLANKNPDIETAKRVLSDADAIFLSGGEVEDGILWLEKAGLMNFLAGLYRGGKLFFGVSAGAIMMGQGWSHWEKEGDDSTAGLFKCLCFVPFIFDAHGEKEEWKELKCTLRLMGSGATGYGLSDGGFYSVDGAGHLTVYRTAPAVFQNIGGEIQEVRDGRQ